MDRPAEFALIRRWLTGMDQGAGVVLGVGDDAAVLTPPADRHLVMTVDTLVSGTHFPEDADARDIGHRALAVSLSDLAAMGATPLWALLALTLPSADEPWLAGFVDGFSAQARLHGLALVGGNLSRGPLTASVQLTGHVPAGQWLSRGGARPGQLLLVSGTPGDAAGGLALWKTAPSPERDALLARYLRPSARVALGQAALGVAAAAIDISDGLLDDLAHLCEASGCGADVQPEALPLSPALLACFGRARATQMALRGSDDYELLLACAPESLPALQRAAAELVCPLTVIGRFETSAGIRINGEPLADTGAGGFRHF